MQRFVLATATLLLAGCASSGGVSTPGGTSRTTTTVSNGAGTVSIDAYTDTGGTMRTLATPLARVWEVLPRVYAALGIPVETLVPTTHTLGNQSLSASRTLAGKPLSTFLTCGEGPFGAPLADTYRVNLSVVTQLAPADNGGSRVSTRVTATASNRTVSGAPVGCGSTGALEALIAERIQELAGR